MIITAISDIHGNLDFSVPKSDLLLIAGDISLAFKHNASVQENWIKSSFLPWLNDQPVERAVFVAGNHDFCFDRDFTPIVPSIKYQKIKYLLNSTFKYNGVSIFGTPYQLRYGDMAFNVDEKDIERLFSLIEYNDIILSHGPPYGYGDLNMAMKNCGSSSFTNYISNIKPKLVVCGHIHCASGVYKLNDTVIINAAITNEQYELKRKPYVLEYINGKVTVLDGD